MGDKYLCHYDCHISHRPGYWKPLENDEFEWVPPRRVIVTENVNKIDARGWLEIAGTVGMILLFLAGWILVLTMLPG